MNKDQAKQYLSEQAIAIEERVRQLLSEEQTYASKISPVIVEVLEKVKDLTKGGKALRGTFVLTAARLKGMKISDELITVAALIEILHLTLLMVDDVIDDGYTRRGIPTVHAVYEKNYSNLSNSKLFGQGIAISASLSIVHFIYTKISALSIEAEQKVSLLNFIHRAIADTLYGELLDVYSVVYEKPTDEYVMKVLDYKTARYTYELPLHVGLLLANGDDNDFLAIKQYSYNAGIAFQIVDDILGVFGDETLGKSVMSDIREGKRTLLVTHAYESATSEQISILNTQLGNKNLTNEGFEQVKEVLEQTGARSYAMETAEKLMKKSEKYLESMRGIWNEDQIEFLFALNQYVLTRNK